jgi:membrane protein
MGARGRDADYPSEVPVLGWRDILLRVREQTGTDNISMIAAGVAFYGLLAIFPAITALVSIWGLVADPAQVQQQFAAIQDFVPAEAWQLLDDQLGAVAATSATSLGWGVWLSGSSSRCGAPARACAP